MEKKTNKELFFDGIVKILKEQEVDVLLKASDSNTKTSIPAHKLILSARSQVFKKMFESDKGKAFTKLKTIILSEFKHQELEAFVDFIYSEGSVLSEKAKKHAMSLYCAAAKYEIPHLRDLCRDTLLRSLNRSNVLKILEVAEIPFDRVLTDAALTTLVNNSSTVCDSTEFEAFVVKHPKLTVKIVRAFSDRC